MAGTLTVSYNHGGRRKKKEARIFKRAMETERGGVKLPKLKTYTQ